MAKLKTYAVDVQRISYSEFVTIEVQAMNPEEAARLAVDNAGDHCFDGESSAEYNVDTIRQVK